MSFTNSTPSSYAEAVRTFNSQDVQNDLDNACGKLAQAMSAMMGKFDSIVKQMHTIDCLRLCSPLKPRWDLLRQDVAELLWQFRTHSSVLCGRLKLFCDTILPAMVRNFDARTRDQYYNDNLVVLQSYMAISREQAAMATFLIDRLNKMSTHLVVFLNDFTNIAMANGGQIEMRNLSQKLQELDGLVRFVVKTTSNLASTEVTHLLHTSSRLVLSAGLSKRSALTRKPIILGNDLSHLSMANDEADRKRNEIAHAQYTSQLQQSRTLTVVISYTMLSSFFQDHIQTSESGMLLFLSIWARLWTDCSDILQWIKNPDQRTPWVVSCYMESGCSLYLPFMKALDVYAKGFESSFS